MPEQEKGQNLLDEGVMDVFVSSDINNFTFLLLLFNIKFFS